MRLKCIKWISLRECLDFHEVVWLLFFLLRKADGMSHSKSRSNLSICRRSSLEKKKQIKNVRTL